MNSNMKNSPPPPPADEQQDTTSLQTSAADMGFSVGNAFSGPAPDRYLGIDPGLQRTGYSLLLRTPRGPRLIEGGVVRSTVSKPLEERVLEIGRGLREILEEHRPQAVAIEQVFSLGKNPKSSLLMAHARGALLYAAADFGISVVHYSPKQVKRLLTGSGAADKAQVQQAVQRELGLAKILEPNDVADATAIALCHYYSSRVTFSAGATTKVG
jgi:crossover junction endodeoxyribonuclease RuvC